MIYALPPPTLEVFYSPKCAPCRLELPVLADVTRVERTRVRIVILDDERRARAEIHETSPALDGDAADSSAKPRDELLAAGDDDGILPFARSTLGDGRVCSSWRGILTATRARLMIGACHRFISQSSH